MRKAGDTGVLHADADVICTLDSDFCDPKTEEFARCQAATCAQTCNWLPDFVPVS